MLYQVGSTVTNDPISPGVLDDSPGTRLVGKNLWARGYKKDTPLGAVFVVDGYFTTELSEAGTYCKIGKLLSSTAIKLYEDTSTIITIDHQGNIVLMPPMELSSALAKLKAHKVHCLSSTQWQDGVYYLDIPGISEESNILVSRPDQIPPSEILVLEMAQLDIKAGENKLIITSNGLVPIIDVHIHVSLLD